MTGILHGLNESNILTVGCEKSIRVENYADQIASRLINTTYIWLECQCVRLVHQNVRIFAATSIWRKLRNNSRLIVKIVLKFETSRPH